MPFKSKAQMRWMFAAEDRGEVPKGTAKRWLEHTKSVKKLPARVKKSSAKDEILQQLALFSDDLVRTPPGGFIRVGESIRDFLRRDPREAVMNETKLGPTDSVLDKLTNAAENIIEGISITMSDPDSRRDVIRASILGAGAGAGINLITGAPVSRGLVIGGLLGAGASLLSKHYNLI